MAKYYDDFINGYRPRSGQIAVELGFITPAQLKEAISEQLDDDLNHASHRFLMEILLAKGWITHEQVDIILDELFQDDMRCKGKL